MTSSDQCRACKSVLWLIPYRTTTDEWGRAVVCPYCDCLHLMPRGKEPPGESPEAAAA